MGPNQIGDDDRDFSMKGIADRAQYLIDDIDPGILISAKKVGQMLSEELGLMTRQHNPAAAAPS